MNFFTNCGRVSPGKPVYSTSAEYDWVVKIFTSLGKIARIRKIAKKIVKFFTEFQYSKYAALWPAALRGLCLPPPMNLIGMGGILSGNFWIDEREMI